MLVDWYDPSSDRLSHRSKEDSRTCDSHHSAVRPDCTYDDLDERALARSVLAEKGMHTTGSQTKAGAAQSAGCTVVLDDVRRHQDVIGLLGHRLLPAKQLRLARDRRWVYSLPFTNELFTGHA